MSVTQIQPDPLVPDKGAADQQKLKKASAQFEAMFISMMLKTMRESEKLMKQGEGEDSEGLGLGTDNPYQDMFDWQLSVSLSEKSPLGIARQLMQHYQVQMGIQPETPHTDGDLHPDAKPVQAVKLPSTIEDIVQRAAAEQDLDPSLIKAVIAAESGGNPRALSDKGAKGLMQLIDSTAAEVGVRNSFDPQQNVSGGAAYLRRMLDRYGGDQALALAAYNAGPGSVDRYGGIPPYPETVAYVRKILNHVNSSKEGSPAKSESKESQ